jgi:hypothetical protein
MTKKTDKTLSAMEDATFLDSDSNQIPPTDIVAYNELRSCADLYRMYKSGQLDIKPDFQRNSVWTPNAQTRFIDSLMKQLPIPSMCFSLDINSQKRLVIDGLQRISTIIKFLDEKEAWKLSTIADIDPRIAGKTNSEIRKNEKALYDTIENLTIPVTILRCNYESNAHMSYLFTIFHRLNTAGTKLNNQEIRNSIYQGSFNDFLKRTATNKKLHRILPLNKSRADRFMYEEFILRVIAFYSCYEDYNGKLAQFLNDFMHHNKNSSNELLCSWSTIFESAIDIIYDINLDNKFKHGKTVLECVLIGIARNINRLKDRNRTNIKELYDSLLSSAPLSKEVLQDGLSRKDKVIERLNISVKTFGT